eukprot:TRINITY_DN9452_c0_g1_i1.p1 TRINITY_DN9452_c0_g1~~TRINITY_DN9452_c0_g1_i1.p1  ORF type:complete len:885 (+),score=169.41 TRINITY_DN9452_c0_g1_i1:33-2657(+)
MDGFEVIDPTRSQPHQADGSSKHKKKKKKKMHKHTRPEDEMAASLLSHLGKDASGEQSNSTAPNLPSALSTSNSMGDAARGLISLGASAFITTPMTASNPHANTSQSLPSNWPFSTALPPMPQPSSAAPSLPSLAMMASSAFPSSSFAYPPGFGGIPSMTWSQTASPAFNPMVLSAQMPPSAFHLGMPSSFSALSSSLQPTFVPSPSTSPSANRTSKDNDVTSSLATSSANLTTSPAAPMAPRLPSTSAPIASVPAHTATDASIDPGPLNSSSLASSSERFRQGTTKAAAPAGPDISNRCDVEAELSKLTVEQRSQLQKLHSLWHLSKTHYAELDQAGIPYRKGKWSRSEEQMLNGNIWAFMQRYPEQSVIDIVKNRDDAKKFKTEFYQTASRGIWRPIFHIYRRILRLYSGTDDGETRTKLKFSDAERQRLIELHSMYGNKWTKIGKLMQRTADSCREYWRGRLAVSHEQGPWTPEMERELEQIMIKKYMTADYRSIPGTSWASVANDLTLTRRTPVQVQKKWQGLQPRMMQRLRKTGKKPWLPEDDWTLVQATMAQNVPDDGLVDYHKVAEAVDYARSPSSCRRRLRKLLSMVEDRTTMTFADQLQWLLKHRPLVVKLLSSSLKRQRREEYRSSELVLSSEDEARGSERKPLKHKSKHRKRDKHGKRTHSASLLNAVDPSILGQSATPYAIGNQSTIAPTTTATTMTSRPASTTKQLMSMAFFTPTASQLEQGVFAADPGTSAMTPNGSVPSLAPHEMPELDDGFAPMPKKAKNSKSKHEHKKSKKKKKHKHRHRGASEEQTSFTQQHLSHQPQYQLEQLDLDQSQQVQSELPYQYSAPTIPTLATSSLPSNLSTSLSTSIADILQTETPST